MCRKQSVIAHDGSACEPIKDAGDSSSDDDTDTVLIIDRKAIEIAWQKMRNNLINEQSVIVQVNQITFLLFHAGAFSLFRFY